MPTHAKYTPPNEWVWQLQEKLETAHAFVRTHTGKAIERQKQYHDRSLAYEHFDVGDSVYVFFPVKRSEWSPKFTSYWRGPFQILEKVATVLYKVNCGRSGSAQVIHTDRLRKVRPQVLLGE